MKTQAPGRRRLASVWALWWALTKLVLAGRGRYDVYLYAEADSGAPPDFRHQAYVVSALDWISDGDRYVTIVGREEGA